MLRIRIIFFLSAFSILSSYSQEKNISFGLSSSAGYTSPSHVPFWLRSNQFGSVPLDNASASLFADLRKEYKRDNTKFFDWGVSAAARSNFGQKTNIRLIEGLAKLRFGVFEIRAGRSKEIMGLCDTILTSGAWAVSGTAPGIPKVQIGIPEFYTLPFFGRMFAFKGNYAHGWFGEIPQKRDDNIMQIATYLHQKSLYGRFGRPEWKLKLYGGFNHQVQWGNEKDYWGDMFTLSKFKTYLYVITGRGWSGSRMGNSLGSIDMGFEYEFKNIRLFAYRQNLYDAGSLCYLANLRDGLNGMSISNKKYEGNGFQWRKLIVEFLYTKNQAGEPWSKPTPSSDEHYFNHGQYSQGWSYKGIGIGNPFISPRAYTRAGLPSDPGEYFINNRVAAFHFGFEGSAREWDFILKASYSLNYGTYSTSEERNTGIGIFGEKKQFSAFLETNKELKNGLNIGLTGAFDAGELYYNSVGVMLRVGKTFMW